jgi:DNA-directed RNA polymerase specialized sigma54-like protein
MRNQNLREINIISKESKCRTTNRQKNKSVRAVIHNLSLQRFSDTEMVGYLSDKGIVLARTTVNGIKKQIEREAEKWYIELRQSRYKYIATYKERIEMGE